LLIFVTTEETIEKLIMLSVGVVESVLESVDLQIEMAAPRQARRWLERVALLLLVCVAADYKKVV
jgi:hypothetical protein